LFSLAVRDHRWADIYQELFEAEQAPVLFGIVCIIVFGIRG